jgi:hypothetical protein
MRNGSLLKNPTEPRSLQTLAYKPKRVYISGPMPLTFMDMPPPNSFIHLLKGCYEVCTTSLPMSWVLDQDHGDVDVALSSPVSEGKVLVWKPPAVPVSDQPRVWSGTLERRPSDPLKIPGSFPLKSCFVPPTQRPATTAAVRDNRVPADNRHSITSLPTEDSRGTIRIVPEWDYAESEDLSWSYVHHSFSEPYAATAASEAENDNDNNNDDNTVATLVL